MQVKDVMTKGAECIDPTDTIQKAAQRMKSLNVGPLPVCENDRIVGILTDRDIAVRGVAEGCDPKSTPVRDIMTPGIVYCFEDQDVREVAELMQERQIRRVVVLNRSKRMVGIVSLGDLAVETRDEHLAGATLERVSEPVHS